MAFLAGPPDRGRGCVLRRKPVKAPYIPPAMTEISYTSLALGMQPVPLLPTHSSNSSAKGNDNEPAQVGISGIVCTPCMTLHPNLLYPLHE